MATTEINNSAPGFAKHPGYRLKVLPCDKRVRVTFGGETIIDSKAAKLLLESSYVPVYYFPKQDFRSEFGEKTAHDTYCPFKGNASYWTLKAGGKTGENLVWGYEFPYDEASTLAGHVALYWQPMDGWVQMNGLLTPTGSPRHLSEVPGNTVGQIWVRPEPEHSGALLASKAAVSPTLPQGPTSHKMACRD